MRPKINSQWIFMFDSCFNKLIKLTTTSKNFLERYSSTKTGANIK